jgi:putative transcriptional regulator
MSPVESSGEVDIGRVHCRLTELLEARGMAVTELSALVGVGPVNLSVLKNDRAKAIRFSTLVAICDVLECEIGDLLVLRPD